MESLQQENKKLRQDVERFKAEGDYFLVEIKRRDEEIETLDELNANFRHQLEELTENYKKMEDKVCTITLIHLTDNELER